MSRRIIALLWCASVVCALASIVCSAITYHPRALVGGKRAIIAFAVISIVLALIPALQRPRRLRSLIVCVLLTAVNVFQLVPATRTHVETPTIAALIAAYEAPVSGGQGTKKAYGERFGALSRAVGTNPAARDSALQYLADGAWTEHDAPFAGALVSALLQTLLFDHDRDRLLAFLRAYPIAVDGPDGRYIEFDLVDPYDSRPIDDFALLFRAYDESKSAMVREYLGAAVRRAYRAEIAPAMTDQQVMDKYRVEFERTKQGLKANLAYADAYPDFEMNITNWRPMPLFIPKAGPDRVESQTPGTHAP